MVVDAHGYQVSLLYFSLCLKFMFVLSLSPLHVLRSLVQRLLPSSPLTSSSSLLKSFLPGVHTMQQRLRSRVVFSTLIVSTDIISFLLVSFVFSNF
jgi:hypothetical protein